MVEFLVTRRVFAFVATAHINRYPAAAAPNSSVRADQDESSPV